MILIRRHHRSPIVIVALSLAVLYAPAQIGNVGTLETWTTTPISREQSSFAETSYIRTIRTAKHENYDRVVFEFTGPLRTYRIEYLKSNFYQGEARQVRIRSAGKAFVQVEFLVPTSDDQLKYSQGPNFLPSGPLHLRRVGSVTDMGMFEGFYDFVIGVSSRKAFRVTELSNPSRLAVDFKH